MLSYLSLLLRFLICCVLLLHFPQTCIVFFVPLVSFFRALYFFFTNAFCFVFVSLICFFPVIARRSPYSYCFIAFNALDFHCASFALSPLSLPSSLLLSSLLSLSSLFTTPVAFTHKVGGVLNFFKYFLMLLICLFLYIIICIFLNFFFRLEYNY